MNAPGGAPTKAKYPSRLEAVRSVVPGMAMMANGTVSPVVESRTMPCTVRVSCASATPGGCNTKAAANRKITLNVHLIMSDSLRM